MYEKIPIKTSQTSYASTPSRSSYEEGDLVDYELFDTDQKHDAPRKYEYYYQEYKYVKPTQADFDRKQIKGGTLFDSTKKITKKASLVEAAESKRDGSILVSGFGMRNVDSFQKLIKMSQEERRKWELRKLWRDEHGKSIKSREEEALKTSAGQSTARTETTEVSTVTETLSPKTSSDLITQTEATPKEGGVREDLTHLDYLLGIEAGVEEEPEPFAGAEIEVGSEEDFKYSTSKTVREAQRYLRVHRIFECFQFIVAHLLSAHAENPIEFILNLLNRCLIYRSGLGEPPLLYEQRHINKLFDLMDRWQTGFIDRQQYVSGMKTLGICTYNENPEVNEDGMISRETFLEEAYDAEIAIFDDLIKRRPEKQKKKTKDTRKPFDIVSIPSVNPPYFIPPDLFRSSKTKVHMTHQQETMGE